MGTLHFLHCCVGQGMNCLFHHLRQKVDCLLHHLRRRPVPLELYSSSNRQIPALLRRLLPLHAQDRQDLFYQVLRLLP